uniref:HECT domain-containing protein n=1 Tax=Astyanax mexicanus TaxID=7994 RepID=A0A3B1IN00_ASTMX
RTPKMSTELLLLQAGLGRRDSDHPRRRGTAYLCIFHSGGSGQRKLNVVQPDEEGYTGAYIIKALGGRGGCLYIMPLQGTLDMSPLPFTSREFDRMPKAQCATCHVDMPIRLLALHAQKCEPDTGSRLNSVKCLSDAGNINVYIWGFAQVSCPLCCDAYPEDCIEEHASTCEGSLADAVCKVKDKIDPQAIFSICVTREEIFHRGLKQWKRQKKKAGIDNGALRKEFLTEMMAGIETNLFEGSSAGKNPKYSIMDYQNDNFKYLFFVIFTMYLSETDVTDPELLDLISKVYIEHVIAIVLHSRVRVLPMLQQICTGLKLYGLHDMIKMLNFILEEPTDALEQETAEQDQAEGKGDNQNSFTVCGMLQWLTGQAHVPITAAERAKFKITVELSMTVRLAMANHGVCYPVVNACSNSIRIPTLHIGTYPEFVHIMKQALINSKEFGRC